MRLPVRAAVLACAVALPLAGCASAPAQAPEIVGPPQGGAPDYQLGGANAPVPSVSVVGRDRGDEPAPGTYSICYVDGFQTQPGELEQWPDDLLLTRDRAVVFDPDWPDEALLDTSTPERREAIVDVVGPWIRGCAADGFDAVEMDNLDTYTRSDGALRLADNVALAAALVDIAHDAGLTAGQKNTAESTGPLQAEAGFDFAVVERCAAYDECGADTDVYGAAVVDIEYTDELPRPFAEVCAEADTPASLVLRDRHLTLPGDQAHVTELCDG